MKARRVHQFVFLAVGLACLGVGVLVSAWQQTAAGIALSLMFVGLFLVNIPRWARVDLTNAERRLEHSEFEEARRLAERFVARVRRHRWLQPVAGVDLDVAAPSVEILGLNVLVHAHIGLGDLAAAREAAKAAGRGSGIGDGQPRREGDVRIDLLNDDKTAMEFVVHVLETRFGLSYVDAIAVMLMIHTVGRASAGQFSLETAEALLEQVTTLARAQGFPLQLELVTVPAA